MRIIRLTPDHVDEYRAIMLEAYADEPEAFIATVAERESAPAQWWESRLAEEPDPAEMVFGAFVDDRLAGAVGLRFRRRSRTRHKAWLFGMAVHAEFRGRGIGRALVDALLEQARSTSGTRVVQLTVAESNTVARRLYESCGFVAFGTEPFAFRVGERFVADVHMWCEVGEDGA